ncbi:hypothetical protein FOZ62_023626 [Perkinsus olseni]|nr:hypothetical protein FOZ62_023626 [Perkinsus olseni]
METFITAYDPLDTPSGFLRWSRPEPHKPSRELWRDGGKKPWYHLATWTLLCGLALACCMWYIGTLLRISYNLRSVLHISVEKLTLEKYVWCGMVTLEPHVQYCARGTIDLKIRNRLWTEITILQGNSFLCLDEAEPRFLNRSATCIGVLDIGGAAVEPLSEKHYSLPVYLTSTILVDPTGHNVSAQRLFLGIHTLGYHVPGVVEYGRLEVPPFTLPGDPHS